METPEKVYFCAFQPSKLVLYQTEEGRLERCESYPTAERWVGESYSVYVRNGFGVYRTSSHLIFCVDESREVVDAWSDKIEAALEVILGDGELNDLPFR